MDVFTLANEFNNSYIQNLPKDVTEEELSDVFKRYGIIQQNLDGSPKALLGCVVSESRSNCIRMRRENLLVTLAFATCVRNPSS